MWVLKSERIEMRYFSHHSSREYRLGKDKRGGEVNKYKSSMSFILKNMAYEDEKCLYDIKNWYMNGLWTEDYRY